jgi:hypothetical protein
MSSPWANYVELLGYLTKYDDFNILVDIVSSGFHYLYCPPTMSSRCTLHIIPPPHRTPLHQKEKVVNLFFVPILSKNSRIHNSAILSNRTPQMPVLAAFPRYAVFLSRATRKVNTYLDLAFWRIPGGRSSYKARRFKPFPSYRKVKRYIVVHFPSDVAELCLLVLPDAYAARLREREAWERLRELESYDPSDLGQGPDGTGGIGGT